MSWRPEVPLQIIAPDALLPSRLIAAQSKICMERVERRYFVFNVRVVSKKALHYTALGEGIWRGLN